MADKITHTFHADYPIPELRGVTATGGELCNLDHKWLPGREPDAVRFDQPRIMGKQIVAKIAGNPELEAILAEIKAAKARVSARLSEIRWPEYQSVQQRASYACAAYERASEHGYPGREAEAMRKADEALAQARIDYPLAALYAQAESYSMASNYIKSGAGRDAMLAIEHGADPEQAISAMRAAWDNYCKDAVSRD